LFGGIGLPVLGFMLGGALKPIGGCCGGGWGLFFLIMASFLSSSASSPSSIDAAVMLKILDSKNLLRISLQDSKTF